MTFARNQLSFQFMAYGFLALGCMLVSSVRGSAQELTQDGSFEPNQLESSSQFVQPIAPAPDFPQSITIGTNRVFISTSAGTPGVVKIRLKAGDNVTWWKGININGLNNADQFLEIQDSPNGYTRIATFNPEDLTNDGFVRIDFWQAAGLGVHTFMVTGTIDLEPMVGRIVTFTWQE